MKHFLSIGAGATLLAIGMILGAAFALWFDGNSCTQQQAGYQVVVTAQTSLLQTRIDLLAKEKARAGLLQAAHTALQEELAIRLAQSVVIPEPKAMLVSQLEPIADRAARLAPVEAAVKEVAKQEGGFIDVPWIKQQLWKVAPVAAGFLTRGK